MLLFKLFLKLMWNRLWRNVLSLHWEIKTFWNTNKKNWYLKRHFRYKVCCFFSCYWSWSWKKKHFYIPKKYSGNFFYMNTCFPSSKKTFLNTNFFFISLSVISEAKVGQSTRGEVFILKKNNWYFKSHS